MFAQKPLHCASKWVAVLLTVLGLVASARAADLGLNPVVGTGSQTINAVDTFTGTVSVGTTGLSGGSLIFSADYSTGQSFAFAGNGSSLSFSSGVHTLTLLSGASLTRSGNGSTTVSNNLANAGAVSVTGGTLTFNGSLANAAGGTLSVSGSGSTLTIGSLANAGTISASSNGIVQFNSTVTTANLGTLTVATGGRALLNSTVNNTAATLAAPGSGSFELNGGTITGGTVASGALTFTGNGGTLNGTSLTGTVTIPSSTYSQVTGNTTLTGAVVNFGAAAYLYLVNTGSTLTIDSASTLTGDIRIIADGSNGSVLTNAGNITHTHSSGGELYARTFNNSGTITATAGTLDVGINNASYATVNTGTVMADGSGATVNINGNVLNSGILKAQNSGILAFNGTNTTGNL
ncbi:MAG: hypothetical protein NTV51_21925, partial [Verrucomicrobia bacterium]|nr:hypothetical protein [Verrucomicrobiota bacterium]